MNKIYIAHSTNAVPVQMSQMICVSATIESNAGFVSSIEEAPADFDSDGIRGKAYNGSYDWSGWDESEEE